MQSFNGFLCNASFAQCGKQFLDANAETFDAHGARELLARAPWSNKKGLRLYSDILAKLLVATASDDDPTFHETDATLLADYWHGFCLPADKYEYPNEESEFAAQAMEAMSEYADDAHRQGLEFVRIYMRVCLQKQSEPAHRLFDTVANHPATPILTSLFSTKNGHSALRWAVLNKLLDLDDIYTKLAKEAININPSMYFWRTLGPFIAQREWLPDTQKLCAGLWRAHVQAHVEHKPSILTEPALVEAMLTNAAFLPEQVLECLLHAYDVPVATVMACFPIPFERCSNGSLGLNFVMRLATVNDGFRHGVKTAFLPQLELHHKDLWDAVQLHLAVAQTVDVALETSDALLPVFDRIRLGSAETKQEDIDASLFE